MDDLEYLKNALEGRALPQSWVTIDASRLEAMVKEVELLKERERIQHEHLDTLGAPTHGDFVTKNIKLNINGRLDDYLAGKGRHA